MKNKKGFTLIELLAIIVILAIIAVITVPIILNIIDNSRMGAASDSAYGYKDAVNKWYVTKLSSDSNYIIPDDDYTTEQLKNLGVSVSGQEPGTNSWVTIENNNITTGCLQYDEYKVSIEYGKVGNVEKGECEIPVPSFADDSWADIKANLTADRNAYPIGSEKIVSMNLTGTEKYYKLRLVNTEPCSSSIAKSQTSCGVVIEFVTTIGTHNMNSSNTNAGGWYASGMRSYLNSGSDSIYSKLNAIIGKDSSNNDIIISTTPVVSGNGYGGVSNDAEDHLYLLSTREIGINLSYDNKNRATDTNILSYYNSNNNNAARIKYSTTTPEGVDSSPSIYLLRSAYSDTTNYFYGVHTDGNLNRSDANSSYGVAPAFRILD